MKKERYYYNPNSLKYEKARLNKTQIGIRVIGFLASTALFAFIILALGFRYIKTPSQKGLDYSLNNLETKYELLNKRIDNINKVMNSLQDRDNNVYRVIFEADPILEEWQQSNNNKYLASLNNTSINTLSKSAKSKIDMLEKKLYIQSKSYDELSKLVKKKEQMLQHFPAIQPVSNEKLTRIASGFGIRIDPVYKTPKMHAGIDFTAPSGTEVYATGDGVIKVAGSQGDGYGNKVIIEHGYGYQTLYAHNSKVLVHVGQEVKRGHLIALVGSTGKSTGPHCHYEVIKNNEKINPVNFFFNDLTDEEFELVLKMSEQNNQSFD